MDKEILSAILEMVKAGGTYAVWGIVAYWLMQLLTVVAKGGILCLCFRIISQTLIHCWDNYQQSKAKRITLLSEDITDRFSQTWANLSVEVSSLMRELRTQLEELRKSSTKKSTSEKS